MSIFLTNSINNVLACRTNTITMSAIWLPHVKGTGREGSTNVPGKKKRKANLLNG